MPWVVALSCFLAQADQSNPLDLFTKNRAEIETLQAMFTQVNDTPDETYVSTGKIVYVQPRRMIMRYDDPPVAYIFTEEAAYEYDAELAQLRIYDMSQMPEMEALFMGLDNEPARLNEAYEVETLPPSAATKDSPSIRLHPRVEEGETPLFQHATLLLRKEDYLPHEVRISHGEDGANVIRLGTFTIDEPLEKSERTLFVPEGTTIIRNDTFAGKVGPGGRTFPEPKPELPPSPVTVEELDEP